MRTLRLPAATARATSTALCTGAVMERVISRAVATASSVPMISMPVTTPSRRCTASSVVWAAACMRRVVSA